MSEPGNGRATKHVNFLYDLGIGQGKGEFPSKKSKCGGISTAIYVVNCRNKEENHLQAIS